jgi:arsenite methyltransferase
MPSISMLLHLFRDFLARQPQPRVPEPELVMTDPESTTAFMQAGREDGMLAFTYLYHAIQASAVIPPGGQVLDLGCGPANQLSVMARLNPDAHFTGLDASADMLALASDTLARCRLHNVRLHQGNMACLPEIESASMDAVVSTITLHHLPDLAALQACLREVRRVLKPGGGLYLVDFGRLKRQATQAYFANEKAHRQPAAFTEGYYNSLRAAFSVAELREAASVLGDAVRLQQTFLVPFLVALRSTHPNALRPASQAAAREVFASLSREQQVDFRDIARFFAHGGFPLAFKP